MTYPVVWLTCWGTSGNFTTNFLHSSRFSALCSMMFHSRPVHSLMLSSHCFLCPPLHLPPCTIPCRQSWLVQMIVLCAHTTSACVFSLKSGLFGARWHFQFWFSLPFWLCDLCIRHQGVCGSISSPLHVSFFQCLLLWSAVLVCMVSHAYKNIDMTRECISLILEPMAMVLLFPMTFSLITGEYLRF